MADNPPPSTLAAQLVENISASTKSSKSDENSELKGLFAIIQRVKNDPTILKTVNERVEHNHLLIYVYTQVVLDGIKFDDPFLDRAHVRAEALKTINFLRITVKETPTVLAYKPNGEAFLYRGSEPLWVWLFPQLFRLLGHPQSIGLVESIESLVQYFLLVVAQTPALWDSAPEMVLYLRAMLSSEYHIVTVKTVPNPNYLGLLSYLQDPSTVPCQEDSPTTLDLPPTFTLDYILQHRSHSGRLTYHVDRTSQAIQQVTSLRDMLFYPLISGDDAFHNIVSFTECGIWLLDALIDVRTIWKRWSKVIPNSSSRTIETILSVVQAFSEKPTTSSAFKRKAITLLILLCSEMISNPEESPAEDTAEPEAQRTYCIALATIAKASIQDRSLSRLAASKLVDEPLLLCPTLSEDSDLWVGYFRHSFDCMLTAVQRTIHTLRQVTTVPLPNSLDPSTHPSNFQDDHIRKVIQELSLTYEDQEGSPDDRVKRRKIIKASPHAHHSLIYLIHEALNITIDPNQATGISESEFL